MGDPFLLLFTPRVIVSKPPSTSSKGAEACEGRHAPEYTFFIHIELGVMAEVDDPLGVVSTPEVDEAGKHLLRIVREILAPQIRRVRENDIL
jgi:hypothetical protein